MSALAQLSKFAPYAGGAGVAGAGVYGANQYDDYRTESLGDEFLTLGTSERNQLLKDLKGRDEDRYKKIKAYMGKAPKKKWVPFTADSPDEVSFFDDAQQRMSRAMPYTNEADPMYHMGRGFNKFLARPLIRPAAEAIKEGNPLTSAALGGMAGAPIGLIIGLIRNGLSGAIPGLLKGLGIGAIGGGGLSALGNYGVNRTSGFDKPFVNPFRNYQSYQGRPSPYGVKSASIEKKAFGSQPGRSVKLNNIYLSGVSQAQKSALAAEMRSLSPREKSTLQRLLQGAGGSAATFIIAKYLLGLGKKTTLMSMILGGLGGYNFR